MWEGVMVNLCINLGGPGHVQIKHCFWVCLVLVFLDEMSIFISRLSKTGCSPKYG